MRLITIQFPPVTPTPPPDEAARRTGLTVEFSTIPAAERALSPDNFTGDLAPGGERTHAETGDIPPLRDDPPGASFQPSAGLVPASASTSQEIVALHGSPLCPAADGASPHLTDRQRREARRILDHLRAFARVRSAVGSMLAATRELGLPNKTVWQWHQNLEARGVPAPGADETLSPARVEALLQALAPRPGSGRKCKFELSENESLVLRACVLARSTQDATHFALAVEDFTRHPACLATTRELIRAELDRAARLQRLPNWPISIRRAGMPTVQEAAWFRGRKHAQQFEQADRRGDYWIDEQQQRHPLLAHTIWEMDDASDNEPRRSIDPDTGETILTRQALWTQDVYSAAILGLTQVARARDSYRIEDVADHVLRCVEAWGWPKFMRLEMGDIWAGRFFHGFVPCAPGTTHVLPGWPEDMNWGGLDLCHIVNVHKSKGKGGIEGAFNLIQAMNAHASLSIGRARGEFEEATKALIRGHRTEEIDHRFWSMDQSADALTAVAERFNLRPKTRRIFGRGAVAPADILRAARGLPLLPSDLWRFMPIKRTATVRNGHVEVSVDHYPRPFRFKINGVDDHLHLDHGYTVLIAFHPGRAHEGCHVFNAESGPRNRDGLRRAERLILAPLAADVAQIDLSNAGDFSTRAKANAAVRRAFRAIGQAVKHDYAQDSEGREIRITEDAAGRTVTPHHRTRVVAADAPPDDRAAHAERLRRLAEDSLAQTVD